MSDIRTANEAHTHENTERHGSKYWAHGEQKKHTQNSHCGNSDNREMSLKLSDESGNQSVIIYGPVRTHNVIHSPDPVCAKDSAESGEKDHRSDQDANEAEKGKSAQIKAKLPDPDLAENHEIPVNCIDHGENSQHIEKIKIGKSAYGKGKNIKIRTFLLINLVNAD